MSCTTTKLNCTLVKNETELRALKIILKFCIAEKIHDAW